MAFLLFVTQPIIAASNFFVSNIKNIFPRLIRLIMILTVLLPLYSTILRPSFGIKLSNFPQHKGLTGHKLRIELFLASNKQEANIYAALRATQPKSDYDGTK
jgi:hypothetical protein